MSQENVEIVRAAIGAWNRDDLDAWIQYFDPEVQWSALLEEFRGHAGIRQAWQSFKVDLQLKARFDDIRDLGNSVLALGELTGTGRITGLNLSIEIAQLATFRDGRILGFRDFASHAEALEAVGLSEKAPSQENVEVVKAAFEAWNAGDMDALRDLYDPDVIVRAIEGWPEPGPYVGREAVMRWLAQVRGTWDADTLELTSDFIAAGDRVAARQVWHGAGRGPEASMEMTIVQTVRDGRIFYVEFFWDHAKALETLGLSE